MHCNISSSSTYPECNINDKHAFQYPGEQKRKHKTYLNGSGEQRGFLVNDDDGWPVRITDCSALVEVYFDTYDCIIRKSDPEHAQNMLTLCCVHPQLEDCKYLSLKTHKVPTVNDPRNSFCMSGLSCLPY